MSLENEKMGAKVRISDYAYLLEDKYKENRKMNSAANFQAFGNANFQDTQQLATMRQSGLIF